MGKKYGGQAVPDGVLFSDGENFSVAVRKNNGEIISYLGKESGLFAKYKWARKPFIRGIMFIFDIFSLNNRTKTIFNLMIEAKNIKLSKFAKVCSVMMGLTTGVLLIYIIPKYLSILIHNYLLPFIKPETISTFLGIFILIAYFLINFKFFKELQSLRSYHGAEHKTISCWESNKYINVHSVKEFSTIHPRCGTSFLGYLIFVKLFILNSVLSGDIVDLFLFKLLYLPILFSISYEFFIFMSKNEIKLLQPIKDFGFWMQSFTTAEPTEDQLEVAIVAFNNLQNIDKKGVV